MEWPVDYAQETDEALMALVAQATPEALAHLYDRYRRMVYGIALAITGDGSTAEEITIDAFVRVWRKADTYQPAKARVSTWLINITRRLAIDAWRRRQTRGEPAGPKGDAAAAALPVGSDPLELVETSLRQARLRAALEQLAPDQREALELAYFRGFSQRQIAAALDQPVGTIKTRIRLAIQKLRWLLRDEAPARPAWIPAAYHLSKAIEE